YYLHGNSPDAAGLIPVLPTTPWSTVRPYVEKYAPLGNADKRAGITHRCSRVWFIASHEGRLFGPPTSEHDYVRFIHILTELTDVYGEPTLRNFGYSAAVSVYRFVQPGNRDG